MTSQSCLDREEDTIDTKPELAGGEMGMDTLPVLLKLVSEGEKSLIVDLTSIAIVVKHGEGDLEVWMKSGTMFKLTGKNAALLWAAIESVAIPKLPG